MGGSGNRCALTILDFIADDSFRQSIDDDFREMEAAKASGAWKSAVVIAGSIIEAILVDHLLTSGYAGKTEEQILKLEMGAIIEICKNTQALSSRVVSLSTVIKDYRNLIHPGRSKRLKETVDEEAANIATSLARMVAREIAEKQQRDYGYTAEQVISKISSDPLAFPVAYSSIFPKMHDTQKRKLLLTLLPNENRRHTDSISKIGRKGKPVDAEMKTWFKKYKAICDCIDLTIEWSSSELKKELAIRYLHLVRFGNERSRRDWEHHFFRPEFMQNLDDSEKRTLVDHLFGLLEREINNTTLFCTTGLGKFISFSQQPNLAIDRRVEVAAMAACQAICSLPDFARKFAAEFFRDLSQDLRSHFISVIDQHAEKMENQGSVKASSELNKLCYELRTLNDRAPI